MYKVIFDNGKPYDKSFESENELKLALKEFYLENRDSDYYFDVIIFENDNNITESQLIQEMVAEILNESESE